MSELITWVVMLGPLALGLIWAMRIHNQLVRRRNFVDDAWSGIEVQLKRRQNLIPALWRTVFPGAPDTVEDRLPDLDHRLSLVEAMSAAQQQDAILEKMAGEGVEGDDGQGASAEALKRLREDLAEIESDIEHARRYFNGTAREYNTLVESFPSSLIAGVYHFPQVEYFEIGHAPGAEPG
jgi:LemA protein